MTKRKACVDSEDELHEVSDENEQYSSVEEEELEEDEEAQDQDILLPEEEEEEQDISSEQIQQEEEGSVIGLDDRDSLVEEDSEEEEEDVPLPNKKARHKKSIHYASLTREPAGRNLFSWKPKGDPVISNVPSKNYKCYLCPTCKQVEKKVCKLVIDMFGKGGCESCNSETITTTAVMPNL